MKATLRISLIILAAATASCQLKKDAKQEKMQMHSPDSVTRSKVKIVYTCPMHHQIRSDQPGKCPICGMTLEPLLIQPGTHHAEQLELSPQEQLLAGIRTDTARSSSVPGKLTLTGTTIFDPQDQQVISAWVSGWIEKMYVRNPGEPVKTGQKLYELYSPELLSAEKDYLLALRQKDLFQQESVDFTATLRAMKQRLLRWGLSENQIAGLLQQPPSGKVSVYSKISGYLIQKLKEEGDGVEEGDAVLNLAKNNRLWVQAQLYDSELPLLARDPKISVALDAFPGKSLPGKIVFDNPANENNSRVHLLNIAIPNPGGRIQPGMLAYVYLQTGSKQSGVTVPESAVIYDAKNNYVWIAIPGDSSDQSGYRFERREVELGSGNEDKLEVLKGIKAGEAVVSSGAYLLNSEYTLRYGTGVNMAGMQMSDMQMSGKGK